MVELDNAKKSAHLSKIAITVGSDIDATSSNTDISEYYAITISSISRCNEHLPSVKYWIIDKIWQSSCWLQT